MNLQECYNTKTWQVVQASIAEVYEPDLNKNEHGFMSQSVLLEDETGQHEVDCSTKFESGFVKPEEVGQMHTWKIKCYNGALQGYTQKPAKMGGKQRSQPSQAQRKQYNQAGTTTQNLHPYNAPKEVSIHRQCAMKGAIRTVATILPEIDTERPPTTDEIRTELVDWANFFVHYYRTGNANQPDASITKPAEDTPEYGIDDSQDPF